MNIRETIQQIIDEAQSPNNGQLGRLNADWVAAQLLLVLDRTAGMDDLFTDVLNLVESGAYHKRRGFALRDATKAVATNHLIEEAVELQTEAAITQDREAAIEESADLLTTWFHVLQLCGISLSEVVNKSKQLMRANFTTDPDEIETTTPGVSRRHRQTDDPSN